MSGVGFETMDGAWAGPSRLILEGTVYDSESTARVRHVGQGRFVAASYTWSIEGEPQAGEIVFPAALGDAPANAAWLDSWHMGDVIMFCQATFNRDGFASLLGSYAAPTGPDWGWRTELGLNADDLLVLRMFNITPEGQEELAVHAEYRRAGGG